MTISELKNKFGAFQFYFILIAIIAATLYIGFFWGNMHFAQQQNTVATHLKSIDNLKLENENLTRNLNVLGVELEVAKLAQKQHSLELEKRIAAEKNLRTQLAFYQQVMAPELNQDGFLIEGFNVESSLSERIYRFELVLMQQTKIKNTLKGNLQVTLVGSQNGAPRKYKIESLLLTPEQDKLRFSFKYFQVISGELKLPLGFQPELVSVHADIFQFKRKKGELTSEFKWEEAITLD